MPAVWYSRNGSPLLYEVGYPVATGNFKVEWRTNAKERHMQRKRIFLILIALCFYLYGCGDEGIETVLHDIGAAPPAPGVVGPVPDPIKAIIWGEDVETLMAVLEDALDRDSAHAAYYVHKICYRRAQEVYYTKYISAGGIAIMGNGYIDDRFFYEARDIALGMTQKRPELRALLTPSLESRPGAKAFEGHYPSPHRYPAPSRTFRYILVHNATNLASVPEFNLGSGTINYNFEGGIALGGSYGGDLAWSKVGGYASTDKIKIYHFFSHELAHAIHGAIQLLDPTFNDRLRAARAHEVEGTTKIIKRSSAAEYWAEGVTYWFREAASDVAAYDDMRKREPLLVELLAEWFDLIDLSVVETKAYE